MERVFTHEVIYTTAGHVPVADVTSSLAANEQFVREVGSLLEALLPGVTVDKVDVHFRSASTASPLKEILAASIFLTFQKDLQEDIPAAIESLTGVDIPEELNTIVTVLVVVLAIYGISAAFERLKGKKSGEPVPPTITGDFNQVLQIGGDVLGTDPENIRQALNAKFKAKRTSNALIKRALEFIRPAKNSEGATIQAGGVQISADAIRDAPSLLDLQLDEDEEQQDPYQSQRVVIHATDVDSKKSGWGGHLPGLHEKRLRMQLYPTVDTQALFTKTEFVADIILVSRIGPDGEPRPYMFHVLRVLG